MILVDASAVPDRPSGVRTRLRGLYGAYADLGDAPAVTILVARGSRLLQGVATGSVALCEVPPPGGPLRRALGPRRVSGIRAGDVRLWHSETIPPRAPDAVPRLLTLHDWRWFESRRVTGAARLPHALRGLAARQWLPRLARLLAGVVTVSEVSARRLSALLRIDAGRVFVVENAAPPPRDVPGPVRLEEIRRRLGLPETWVLAVGPLDRRKGFDLLIEALARAAGGSRLSRATLVVVGDGPARERLVGDQVRCVGEQDEETLHGLLAGAAVLAYPSRLEGFGFPVYEALASGCPVVARPLEVLAHLPEPAVRLLEPRASVWRDALDAALALPEGPRRAARELAARRSSPSWADSARRLAGLYRTLQR